MPVFERPDGAPGVALQQLKPISRPAEIGLKLELPKSVSWPAKSGSVFKTTLI